MASAEAGHTTVARAPNFSGAIFANTLLRCNVGGEEMDTLLHFEFGDIVTLWQSIWGGPQAHHLRGTQAQGTLHTGHISTLAPLTLPPFVITNGHTN